MRLPGRRALTTACAVLLVLLVLALWTHRARLAHTLSGVWVGDPAFLQKAGLSAAYLYLLPPPPGEAPARRDGYLFAVDANGNEAEDAAFTARASAGRLNSFLHSAFFGDDYTVSLRLMFDAASGPGVSPLAALAPSKAASLKAAGGARLPARASARLGPGGETLAVYSGGALLYLFVRDNEASLVAAESPPPGM